MRYTYWSRGSVYLLTFLKQWSTCSACVLTLKIENIYNKISKIMEMWRLILTPGGEQTMDAQKLPVLNGSCHPLGKPEKNTRRKCFIEWHSHLESLMWSIPVIFAGLADVGGAIVACWCLQECHCYYWCSLGQGQNLISFTSLESDFPRNTQLSLRHGTARSSLCRHQPRWLLTVCIWYQRPAGLSSSCAVFFWNDIYEV